MDDKTPETCPDTMVRKTLHREGGDTRVTEGIRYMEPRLHGTSTLTVGGDFRKNGCILLPRILSHIQSKESCWHQGNGDRIISDRIHITLGLRKGNKMKTITISKHSVETTSKDSQRVGHSDPN